MIRNAGLGLIILLVALMISPVAACPYPTIIKDCREESVCTNCPMTCDITVTFPSGHGSWKGYVKDMLPEGATYISYTGGSATESGGIVSWSPFSITNAGKTEYLTVTFIPPSGESTNNAEVKAYWSGHWYQHPTQGTSSSSFTAAPCVPEFPTLALPVGMILGFIFIIVTLKTRK